MPLYFSNSAPSNSSAIPSYCTDISDVHPITHATRGFFFRFGYFRKLLTVSKIISSSGVTTNPISAASGLPSSAAVASTANFSPSKNRKTSARSMVDCSLLSFDSNVTVYRARIALVAAMRVITSAKNSRAPQVRGAPRFSSHQLSVPVFFAASSSCSGRKQRLSPGRGRAVRRGHIRIRHCRACRAVAHHQHGHIVGLARASRKVLHRFEHRLLNLIQRQVGLPFQYADQPWHSIHLFVRVHRFRHTVAEKKQRVVRL